ncbi:hypothetical protein [Phreatobacter sp.]|uniref:hypothetical protein n=1 Tax=Phreatobacter sp. TaxID=1966341 RepID=UPI0022BE14FC|nr:hypothetical protein [Phreatobacter sp.]MCZ8313774.1 hypothetical protein [Phreatobacter sp.]
MAASRAGSTGLGRWLNAAWLSPFGMLALLNLAWDLVAFPDLAKKVRAHFYAQGGID